MIYSSVTVQITPKSQPALPSWMGEVAAFAHILTHTGTLATIAEQVRFARARQRALPQLETLPAPHRRFDQVCAPGYQGPKRGEVVRTRTVILQVHTHQFLGTFGEPGNGDYRGELLRAITVITDYARHPGACSCFRVAPLLDVLAAGLGVIARSRDYHLLDLEVVKLALMHAPDRVSTHPESGMTRTLYDCKHIPLTPAGPEVRLVVATHATTSASPTIGVERDGMVYELKRGIQYVWLGKFPGCAGWGLGGTGGAGLRWRLDQSSAYPEH